MSKEERSAELCQGCTLSEGAAACAPLLRDWEAPPGFTRLPLGYVFLRRLELVCHVHTPGDSFGLCVPAEVRPLEKMFMWSSGRLFSCGVCSTFLERCLVHTPGSSFGLCVPAELWPKR